MPLQLQRLSRQIVSYRVGYSPQRPYPWKWTTPAVLGTFLLLSGFLTALNVPLSAYNIVQERTYRPNDTLPALLLSNMIPGIFQNPTDGFSPQTLKVGDGVQLNNSFLNFTVVEAFDGNTQPVSSFFYYNNPFSDNCDVTEMTAMGELPDEPNLWNLGMTVTVTCRIPTLFTITWSVNQGRGSFVIPTGPAQDDFNELSNNLMLVSGEYNITSFGAIVKPCCNCGSDLSVDTSPTQSPCSSLPARFIAIQRWVATTDSSGFTTEIMATGPNTTDMTTSIPSFPGLNQLFGNTFQSLYNLVRMQLGVILDNQIYAYPEMYNRSISDVYAPRIPINSYEYTNQSRISTSNVTWMSEWKESVRVFNESDRVPVMLYFRPTPRLKPLGPAITSVFVSTFAMLSTLWTIFSIVAGALARSSHADLLRDSATSGSRMRRDEEKTMDIDEWDTPCGSTMNQSLSAEVAELRRSVAQNSIAMAEMQRSLSQLRLSHGFREDGNEEHPLDVGQDLGDNESATTALKDVAKSPASPV
ncbi:hypothetical protein B0H11DRAFT_1947718 [Mycena galericulata]|nr:hypothetical protein B0H11DRAFT_1947718 [Mycena galericulata]